MEVVHRRLHVEITARLDHQVTVIRVGPRLNVVGQGSVVSRE